MPHARTHRRLARCASPLGRLALRARRASLLGNALLDRRPLARGGFADGTLSGCGSPPPSRGPLAPHLRAHPTSKSRQTRLHATGQRRAEGACDATCNVPARTPGGAPRRASQSVAQRFRACGPATNRAMWYRASTPPAHAPTRTLRSLPRARKLSCAACCRCVAADFRSRAAVLMSAEARWARTAGTSWPFCRSLFVCACGHSWRTNSS